MCGNCENWFHNSAQCLGFVQDPELEFICYLCDSPDELFIENVIQDAEITVSDNVDIF